VLFNLISRSYSRYYRREQARENWEIKNYIEGEKREMVELWTSRGLDEGTATDVIEKISKHPAFFADIMMKVAFNYFRFVSLHLGIAFSLEPLFLSCLLLTDAFPVPLPFRTSSTFRTLTLIPWKLQFQAALDSWAGHALHHYQWCCSPGSQICPQPILIALPCQHQLQSPLQQ
jgi:ABC-type sugar transport system permease subunit